MIWDIIEKQKQLAKKLGIRFKETDPVFTNDKYKTLITRDVNDRLREVLKDIGVEDYEEFASHALRRRILFSRFKK